MAHAQFHKDQRVYVKPVGTWATIERVIPQWTKGLDEPLRVYYDVGLGREFGADELEGEETADYATDLRENWRIVRLRNKWQPSEDCASHPFPGTFPVVVTGERDWGGWRVPGAEYDLEPLRIETQAKIMASSLRLVDIATRLVAGVASNPGTASPELVALAKEAHGLLATIGCDTAAAGQDTAPPPPKTAGEEPLPPRRHALAGEI